MKEKVQHLEEKHNAAEEEKEAALKAQERSEHQRILSEHKYDLVTGARIQAFLDIVGRPCDLDQEPLPSVEAFGINKAAVGSKGQAESAQ